MAVLFETTLAVFVSSYTTNPIPHAALTHLKTQGRAGGYHEGHHQRLPRDHRGQCALTRQWQ